MPGFPRVFERYQALLQEDAVVVMEGRLSVREEDAPKLLAERITAIAEWARKKENGTRETATAPARVEMPPEKTDAETAAGAKKKLFLRMNRTEMTRACALLGLYPGDVPVYLHFPEEKTTLLAPRASWCDAGEACLKRLRDEMGPENVVLKGG